MNAHAGVASALANWPRLSEEDGHILVPTHCLYPSSSSVTVWVVRELGPTSFTTIVVL